MFDDKDRNDSNLIETMLGLYIGWHLLDDDTDNESKVHEAHDNKCRYENKTRRNSTGYSLSNFYEDLCGLAGVALLFLSIFGNKTAQYILGGICSVCVIWFVVCHFRIIVLSLGELINNLFNTICKYCFSLIFASFAGFIILAIIVSFKAPFSRISFSEFFLVLIGFLGNFAFSLNYIYPKMLKYLSNVMHNFFK